MKAFMDENFLLNTPTAQSLYHGTAETLPILDYHCHISPKDIAENQPLGNISKVWLGGDHYKWRAMRASGIPEQNITGDGSDWEKFLAFVSIMPGLIGNPIYHWSHLELKRAFGIDTVLNAANAKSIYDRCNEQLADMTPRDIMRKFHVKAICTTDDPADDLRCHRQLRNDPSMDILVLPAFRPDKAVNIEKPSAAAYLETLGNAAGIPIRTAADVVAALKRRMEVFRELGCMAADHGMDYCMFAAPDEAAADCTLTKVLAGETVSQTEADAYKTFVTVACAKAYAELGWAMQLHFGCLRNTNTVQFAALGPDSGYDAVNSNSGVANLARLLNAFRENDRLPKTIVYSLNPADNTAAASIIACFQGDGEAGKLQMGSAWWFNDHLQGIRNQLSDLAANGVLGQFVGMLTDSRSFLSYPRHEYFRRILCDLVGGWVEQGLYPNDPQALETLISNICYYNTKHYFPFPVTE